MKKGQVYEGIVSRVDFPNKGIIEHEEGIVTVKNTIPNQKIRFSVNKIRKGKNEGRLLEVMEKSPLESRNALCKSFGLCGGCTYQTIDYDSQLEIKKNQVKKLLDQVCDNYTFEGIKKSPVEFSYRNKMEYSFGDDVKDGPLTLGLHKKGSFHDVLTVDDCCIVSNDYNKILKTVLDFFSNNKVPYYKKMKHEGYLRHLIIREGKQTGEILVNLVTTSSTPNIDLTSLVNELISLNLDNSIVGILHTINDTLADVVQCDDLKILYGKDYFYEMILGLKFKISPFSFFQTNSLGAEVLYSTVRDYVGDTTDKVVFDLYSGTGTIAQILAGVAKKVIGVEIISEAVDAAKKNALLNNLGNCEFIAGDVLKVINEIEYKPDLIVLDPPRDGIHPKALTKIIEYGVEKIVYISCKPTSLVRDLKVFLECGYNVEKVTCVDMFPATYHVECVVLMSRI